MPRYSLGESVIKYRSPLNVLKDTYDYSCCLARSYEYNHLMTDSPGAIATREERVEDEGADAHRDGLHARQRAQHLRARGRLP
jgi:hypothetical protein